jgi:uncharacterized membrane protein YcfT
MQNMEQNTHSTDARSSDASSKGRVNWVDTAKGICIIFVVMMHAVLGVESYSGELGFMHTVVAFAAPFRMPDFFLISGLFLASVVVRDWRSFTDKRILHFVYFYVLWLTIQFALKAPGIVADVGIVGAMEKYLYAFVQPFGTLWFIYMLPIFALITKLAWHMKLPHWFVLAAAALLQIAPVHSGYLIIDAFAERFVYFYAGYALAPMIFQYASWVGRNIGLGSAILGIWAVVNGVLVFNGGYAAASAEVTLGFAGLPVVNLLLGLFGAVAITSFAAIVSKYSEYKFLAYCGANSIAIYLAFFVPMAASRAILVRLGVLDIGTVSLLVNVIAVVSPLILLWLIQRTGYGSFLFARPDWAKLDGRPSSQALQPAE